MQVDILLNNARVYDINRVDIVKGESFSLETDHTDESKWFSDNDPVLTLNVSGNNATAKAAEIGDSTILIMNASFEVLKKIIIRVVDAILPMATNLGLTPGTPEIK